MCIPSLHSLYSFAIMCVLLLPLRAGCMVVGDVLLRGISVACVSYNQCLFTFRTILRTLGFRGRIFCLSGGLVLRRTMILPDMRVNKEANHDKRGANRQCYEHHRGR